MVVPMKSAARFLMLALVLVVASPKPIAVSADTRESAAPSDHARQSADRQRAARKDRVFLRQAGPAMVVEIYRVTGIGDMILNPPPGGWPAAVVVHLHGFSHLESFTAHTPAIVLTCEQTRPEGVPPRLVCHLVHEETDAIQRKADHFEVVLPASLLHSGDPVDIHWVDQWR
jgi:hypothetical protein